MNTSAEVPSNAPLASEADARGNAPGADEGNRIEAFTRSLDRLDVAWTRCSTETLPEVLAEVLAEEGARPAVGAPLPFADLSPEQAARAGLTLNPTTDQLEAAQTGVTAAFLGIAAYGSVVVRHGAGAEAISLFPERHVAVLRTSDVVPDLPTALRRLGPVLRTEQASFVLATGPSATADMGALVRGAHGPKAVHVLLVEG